ncbi:murein biosynthesis integral membrane protein MurJ [Glaciihabitans sp. GrIS 2.15]|uniref:murein biosynthesis integral membrane protein MurJ n=1 Tax=Glaciihabitans sp. GrIS 2.15 TaxID=3071710 RepID=UPI002E029AC4|nr:putative peptidoglycan lipid II flippase [Glaciihabitans sp. GrIS 2.15]
MTTAEGRAAVGGMGRASAILAAGTIVSRVLGFVRTIVLAAAIGTFAAGDTFAIGNQLPNNIYALVAGGVLSAVLVPQIVRAAADHDGGQQFINRVVTLGIMVFAVVTLAATLAAPALVALYAQPSSSGRGFTSEALALATAFAYWCLPQIFFYALYSLLSEVLNARRVFGPFTWAPALNNVVSIAGLVLFMALFGAKASNGAVADWDPGKVAILGAITTLAVAAQAFILFLFWRRAGLRYRPDFHWRGVGLAATGKAAGWLFGMILITQIAGVFQSRVASIASGQDASVSVLQYSWLIFMLPHSVIAVSIATVYFTRMSGHASTGDLAGMRSDLSASLRSIGLLIVFAAVALSIVAYPFARLFTSGFANVQSMANVLLAFLPGLILFSALFVLQRVFYALGDTRTPFFMQCVQSGFFIVGALLCGAFLPNEWIGVGIAAVTSTAGSAQTVVAIVLVRKRIGGIDGRLVLRRHVQYLVFALVAGAVGFGVLALFGGLSPTGFAVSGLAPAFVSIVADGVVMSTVYFGLLAAFRNPELAAVTSTLTARFRRGR